MKKYENYIENLKVLSRAGDENLENEFITSGIIDKFYVQFELGWKVLKELLQYEGANVAATGSPREILKEAYKIYDFIDEDVWLEMLNERNNTSHIYDSSAAKILVEHILEKYIPEFEHLQTEIDERYGDILEIL